MPLTAADGPITKAEEHLADMIAACATFQSITGSIGETEALTHIYFDSLPPPAGDDAVHTLEELEGYRPFALIYSEHTNVLRATIRGVDGSGHRFSQSGNLKFYVEIDVDPDDADDPQEAERKLKNTFGKIFDELSQLAGQAGYIAATTIEFTGPARSHPDEQPDVGDFHCGWFEVDYDNQGT
jgi:hypothetical protein